MVGWKPLLRQGDAHTVSPNVRSHLHLPTRPSKSLQVPPAFRSSASKPGTPRNRLHSAALPANQIAHSRDPRARLSPILSHRSASNYALSLPPVRRGRERERERYVRRDGGSDPWWFGGGERGSGKSGGAELKGAWKIGWSECKSGATLGRAPFTGGASPREIVKGRELARD